MGNLSTTSKSSDTIYIRLLRPTVLAIGIYIPVIIRSTVKKSEDMVTVNVPISLWPSGEMVYNYMLQIVETLHPTPKNTTRTIKIIVRDKQVDGTSILPTLQELEKN